MIHVDDPDRLGRGNAEFTVNGQLREQANAVFPTDGSTFHVHVRLRPQHAPISD
jgi:hypothetical protein